MIRVLIVDDSPLAAEILSGIFAGTPDITVVGVAQDGLEALDLTARLRPDLITMDVWMPRLDGFSAVEQIMAYHPTPILVVTTGPAAGAGAAVEVGLKMLAAGALDVIEKPARHDNAGWAASAAEIVGKVRLLAGVPVVTHLRGRRTRPRDGVPATTQRIAAVLPIYASASPLPLRRAGAPYDVVAVAASTGGPQALLAILSALPAPFPLPILIVQHIGAGFGPALADWLSRATGHAVRLAVAGQGPVPGLVLLAPDGHHLSLGPDARVRLEDGPPCEPRPAADVLFQAVAGYYAARAIGIVLTGMGRDGAEGLLALRRRGAYTIAQDEPTSVIFGMPRAAIDLDAIDAVLPLDDIAPRITRLTASTAWPTMVRS